MSARRFGEVTTLPPCVAGGSATYSLGHQCPLVFTDGTLTYSSGVTEIRPGTQISSKRLTGHKSSPRRERLSRKGACGDYRIRDSVGHLNGLAARLFDAEAATFEWRTEHSPPLPVHGGDFNVNTIQMASPFTPQHLRGGSLMKGGPVSPGEP